MTLARLSFLFTTCAAYAAALVLTLFASVAQATECPEVSVSVMDIEVSVDHSKTSMELWAMSGGKALFGALAVTPVSRVVDCAATIGYTGVTMYIAKELPQGSCAFKHTLEHELQHVALYASGLSSAPERIAAAAYSVPLSRAVALVMDQNRQLSAALDSHDEYARNRTACGGALLRLIGRPDA